MQTGSADIAGDTEEHLNWRQFFRERLKRSFAYLQETLRTNVESDIWSDWVVSDQDEIRINTESQISTLNEIPFETEVNEISTLRALVEQTSELELLMTQSSTTMPQLYTRISGRTYNLRRSLINFRCKSNTSLKFFVFFVMLVNCLLIWSLVIDIPGIFLGGREIARPSIMLLVHCMQGRSSSLLSRFSFG